MSRREYLLLAVSPLLMLLLAAGTPAAPPVDNAGSAVLSTYDSSSGETYFALSLTPTVTPKRASAHDVLVLFDTSASQTGAYRDDALDGLRTMLTSLAPEDRVKLMAIDLNAIAMTDGFVAPGSEAMTAGLSKLGKRVPLGSTDMRAALKGATTSFSGDAANPRSVIYIGDGMSRANLLETGEFASLVDKLVSSRVSVSSFAIGPGRDVHMLAALANHTGGMVYLDAAEGRSSDRAGLAMADVVRATVYWPVSAKLPADMQDALPQRMPPLRSDRDTVLLGSLGSRRTQQVAVTAEANGRPVEMLWNVAAEPSNDDYSFLPQMVATARDNGGIGLPTVGSAGLRLVASLVADNNEALAKLGATALRNGDNNGAMKVANAVLKRDPNNPQALVIRDAIERRGGSARANDEPELRLVALQDPDAAAPAQPGGGLLAELGDEGAFLNSVQNTEEVMRQKIQAEVEEELSDARDRLGSNPQGAKNDLKLLQETVENSTDLDPDSRAQLLDQVQSAIREAGRRAYEEESRRALAEENRAASEDRQQLVKELAEKRQKIKQMMVKFNSMMDEGRYRDAEDIIAENVRELDPLGTTPVTATWAARFGGHVSTLVRLREVRHKNFALTLLEVEKSLIPFPGDPPILYPEPQVWADLTLRRKKYASIDLARTGGAEAKILEALDDDTRLEFIETPLDQVVDFLKDQHGINIELDAGELDNVGIGTDVPITRNLKGITLRSALRLMLKDLELTYVIRDEVLLITTPEEAEAELVTKVYPVGDLVLPIQSGMGMGGMMGGMGGGMGGMGGGMGGMGGGMGGMGGGMGGMGGGMGGMGGMGGGGMFAVEDDLRLGVKKKSAAFEETTAARPAGSRPATTSRTKATKIELDVQPGESVHDAWDKYFEALKDASPEEQKTARARIHETVRDLMTRAARQIDQEDEAKKAEAVAKCDEVVTLVQAALRHGFPQTWMYEAMGLAMKAKEAPNEEIERALMSVVDFATNMDDVLIVAEYMTGLDLNHRALELFRNVAEAQPMRPEPYVRGLAVAQSLDDAEGVKWACLGLLRQAWTEDREHIGLNAVRVARATYQQMKADGRTEEAEQFDKQLQLALRRDILVKVIWTGDADIDLRVEEPTGTVCSAQNPYTTGGGVMLGDNWARLGGESPDGYSEYYVCPEGFSGEYRMLIKSAWGKPTAGKITVEVATNFGSDKQLYFKKQVPLGEKGAAVLFQLDEGRRNDPLDAQQIANVARVQQAISRAVLAQQLAAYDRSDATMDYARSALLAQRDGRLPRRGVGVRPVITQLPEGSNFSASAVISADRRYVRVTPMPMFSGVGEVTTFTFTGSNTGTQGTTGGGGGGGFGGGGGGGFGGGGGGFGGGGFSDARLKTNVEPLKYGLQTVKQLNPVRYNWADSVELPQAGNERAAETRPTVQPSKAFGRQAEVGLIAQQVEELVPEVVSSDDPSGFKRLSYDKLVPVLIKAVQELSTENEQLKSEINAMKARLDEAGM